MGNEDNNGKKVQFANFELKSKKTKNVDESGRTEPNENGDSIEEVSEKLADPRLR